jgi:transcriptional regulator with XRE-family HTH domain
MRNERAKSIGDYIREQREQARISVRQLAQTAGVSNPYLSQIERGLRKPSADILQQLAKGLRISAEALYVQAGILDDRPADSGVRSALLTDPELSERQKQVLMEIYESFRKENAAMAATDTAEADTAEADTEAAAQAEADAQAEAEYAAMAKAEAEDEAANARDPWAAAAYTAEQADADEAAAARAAAAQAIAEQARKTAAAEQVAAVQDATDVQDVYVEPHDAAADNHSADGQQADGQRADRPEDGLPGTGGSPS